MAKILVVEDDRHLSDMIFDWLSAQKHLVEVTHDGFEGIELSQAGAFDLLVLDWNLPRITGIDICKEYRAAGGKSPVIMLTGKKEINEKAAGFEAGADDYLTKPFHPQELCMRVNGLLRRAGLLLEGPLEIAGLSLNVALSQVRVRGQELRLSTEELRLLELFMKHPNTVFDIFQILEELWPSDKEISPDDLSKWLFDLINKLGEPSPLSRIEGTCYRLLDP